MQPSRARGLDLSHYALMEDGAPLSPPLGPCHLFHFAVHLAERLQATPSKIFSELISARLIRLDSDCVSNGRIDFRLASKLNKRGGYTLRPHFLSFLFSILSLPLFQLSLTLSPSHFPLSFGCYRYYRGWGMCITHNPRSRKDKWNAVIDIWIFPETVNWHIKQDQTKKKNVLQCKHFHNRRSVRTAYRVDFLRPFNK